MTSTAGRHRARPSSNTPRSARPHAPVAGALGVAGLAVAGAAVIGLTPTLSSSPQLLANVYYLKGTQVGNTGSHIPSQTFVSNMMSGAGLAGGTFAPVDYPAGFWPLGPGLSLDLSGPTYDESVGDGVTALNELDPQPGDTVFGFSQGAVVATEYKRDNLGNGVNYVLVENPNRPNGGILERFSGVHIPLLDVAFNGATPVVADPESGSGTTVDIARQYDGWADFPTYPLNLPATANAIAGIYYLHGGAQDLTAADVSDVDTSNPMYYQVHGDTTYYLIPTDELPILMPFNGIVPKPVLDAVNPALKVLVELGYDRTDYSQPTTAKPLPINPATVAPDLVDATIQGVQTGLSESGLATTSTMPGLTAAKPGIATLSEPKNTLTPPKLSLPKLDLGDIKLPTKPVTGQRLTPPLRTKFAPADKSPGKDLQSSAKSISSALKSLAPKKSSKDKLDKHQDKPTGSVGDPAD